MDETMNHLEHKKSKNCQSQQEEKRIQKNKDSVSSHWDNFKRSNIHIVRLPEGEEQEQEIGNVFEKIMKENFPNLVKEIDMQVQETQTISNEMDAKRPTPRYIIITMLKVKDKRES